MTEGLRRTENNGNGIMLSTHNMCMIFFLCVCYFYVSFLFYYFMAGEKKRWVKKDLKKCICAYHLCHRFFFLLISLFLSIFSFTASFYFIFIMVALSTDETSRIKSNPWDVCAAAPSCCAAAFSIICYSVCNTFVSVMLLLPLIFFVRGNVCQLLMGAFKKLCSFVFV